MNRSAGARTELLEVSSLTNATHTGPWVALQQDVHDDDDHHHNYDERRRHNDRDHDGHHSGRPGRRGGAARARGAERRAEGVPHRALPEEPRWDQGELARRAVEDRRLRVCEFKTGAAAASRLPCCTTSADPRARERRRSRSSSRRVSRATPPSSRSSTPRAAPARRPSC